MTIAIYDQGKIHGEFVTIDLDGTISKGNALNGKPQGK
jgi:hypothetical protein